MENQELLNNQAPQKEEKSCCPFLRKAAEKTKAGITYVGKNVWEWIKSHPDAIVLTISLVMSIALPQMLYLSAYAAGACIQECSYVKKVFSYLPSKSSFILATLCAGAFWMQWIYCTFAVLFILGAINGFVHSYALYVSKNQRMAI